MSQRYNENTKRPKLKKKSAGDLDNLCILLENSAEGLRSRRKCCWGYISVYENTPEKLSSWHYITTILSGSRKGAVGA